ncbi:MAG: hypothetical protein OEY14_18620, partial [Myxococcales bacterium]|nr:hypothetical protein [Myxococcales bacterium]
MGYWSAMLAETSAASLRETLASKQEVRLRTRLVREGGGWVVLDGHAPTPDGDLDLAEARALSAALGCAIVLVQGHTVVDWLQYARFEGGEVVRQIEGSQGGWKVSGDAAQGWERAFVE